MYAPLAQLVEQLTLNQWVQGSSPWRCTTYSSIAQSVERMTVNHDVTGSSPVRGARKKHLRKQVLFSTKFALRASEIALLWNIYSANVKYSLRECWQISFHIERSEIFHNVRQHIISHSATPNISLNWLSCQIKLNTEKALARATL